VPVSQTVRFCVSASVCSLGGGDRVRVRRFGVRCLRAFVALPPAGRPARTARTHGSAAVKTSKGGAMKLGARNTHHLSVHSLKHTFPSIYPTNCFLSVFLPPTRIPSRRPPSACLDLPLVSSRLVSSLLFFSQLRLRFSLCSLRACDGDCLGCPDSTPIRCLDVAWRACVRVSIW
jgi:hypothetical protein